MEENSEEVVGDTTEKWLEWKCVFCKQDLKDSTPKLMPCFHSCCGSCIGTDENGRGVLKCPVCQQAFNQSDVIDNYFMRELNNENKVEENNVPTCTSCEDNAAATSFCTDCGEWLCDACVQAHQRVRVTKDHVIRSKDETVAEQGHAGTVGQRIAFCPVHKQEQLKLFCETCDMLTCRDCQLEGHRDHRYQFVSEACKQQKAYIQTIVEHLKEQKTKLEQAKDDSTRVYKDLVDKEQTIREEIKQFAMLFISEIGQRSRQLVKDLHNICGHKKAELSMNNKGVIDLIMKMKHSLSFVNDALEQGSDLALLYSKSVLLKQLLSLQRRPYNLLSPSSSVDLKFTFENQQLVNYIRNLGTLMVVDTVVNTGRGEGMAMQPHLKNQGHSQRVLRQPQTPMNGLNQMLNRPPAYKPPPMNMGDSKMNQNSASPTHPLVSSSSQASFRQQNTHLWNLLEKPGPAPPPPNCPGNPFVKPSGTYVPPSGMSSPRPILPRMPSPYPNGKNSTLQKMLMGNEPTSSSPVNTHQPRNSVTIRPAGANTGAQVSVASSPNSIVPNIIIVPMGQQGPTHQQQPQQCSLPQYHHPQAHYHPPKLVHAPVSSPNSISQCQGGHTSSGNILVTSGTQRLSHFPMMNSRAPPHLRPLAPTISSPNVVVPPPTGGSIQPSAPGRPWVSSPNSTITISDNENSQDRNLKDGANVKPEKVSSSQRPSCGLMGITIKQERYDNTDDICREMAANVYKELSQDSMDGMFSSLRNNIAKEAEAAGSSMQEDTRERAKTMDKVVQADSSSSPDAVLENSLDNVLSNSSASTSRASSIGISESGQQNHSTNTRIVKEVTLDDGNISDASTEKALSPKESELVDLTSGDTSESEGHASPVVPKILETHTLSTPQSDDPNEDWCAVCHDGGDLICCSKCPKVYHLHCHVPALPPDSQEEDNWQCLMCKDVQAIPDDVAAPESAAGSTADEAESKKRKFLQEISGKTLKICERILLEIYCHESSPPFHEPVSKVDVPEYHKVIQKPMCLEHIKMKLDPDSYSRYDNVTEFFQDVRLVFENCYTFNEKTSDVYGAAMKVERHFMELVTKYFPDFEYKNSQPITEIKPRVKRRKQASVIEDIKNFIY